MIIKLGLLSILNVIKLILLIKILLTLNVHCFILREWLCSKLVKLQFSIFYEHLKPKDKFHLKDLKWLWIFCTWLITGFVARVRSWVLLVEHNLLTPKGTWSHPCFYSWSIQVHPSFLVEFMLVNRLFSV